MTKANWPQWNLTNQFDPVDRPGDINTIELLSEEHLRQVLDSIPNEQPTLLIFRHSSGKHIVMGIGPNSAGVVVHWDPLSQRGLYAQPLLPHSLQTEVFYC